MIHERLQSMWLIPAPFNGKLLPLKEVIMEHEIIKGLCISARNARDKMGVLEEQHLCKEVSLAVCFQAASNGLVTCLCEGTFKDGGGVEREHFWVRAGHKIYDATVDQFDKDIDLPYIFNEGEDERYSESRLTIINPKVITIISLME